MIIFDVILKKIINPKTDDYTALTLDFTILMKDIILHF